MDTAEKGVNNGEATPGASPASTTEQGSLGNPEGSDGLPQTVPYERFKEVTAQLRERDERLRHWEENIAPTLESLRPADPVPEQPDLSKFGSLEEYTEFMNKNMESVLSEREAVLEQKFYSQMAAAEKLSEAKEAYPELKTDRVFRDMVITKLRQDPNTDVMLAAKQVKDYIAEVESRGRESAKNEFIEKGFQGRSEGNRPMQTPEDKEFVNGIVSAGGKSGMFS